jgi:ABC-type methionine transport system ATPase subunit
MAFMFPTVIVILNLSNAAVLWIGANRISAGSLTLGEMIAFLSYLTQILIAVMMATFMAIMVPRAAVCAERIQDVLDTPSSVRLAAEPVTEVNNQASLEFLDVGFNYPGAEAPVLSQISLRSLAGQTTAIIGSTGSGKTTLLNLVPRLFDATSGAVLVDGVDVRDLHPDVLRRRVGLVPQKPYLFSGTVASNLRYGKPDATDEEIWEALEVAQAVDFVRAMPGGIEATIAQGGTNVSGGQRQRLAIARALVRKPEIYLFDDSFSALDLRTDAQLRAALVPYTVDSTIIVVAQRVSTISGADQILVLEDGQMVGLGRHDDCSMGVPRTPRSWRRRSVSRRRRESRPGHPARRRRGGHPAARRRAPHRPGRRWRFIAAGVPAERSADFGGTVRRLGKRMRHERLRVAAVFLLAICSVTLIAFGPKVLGTPPTSSSLACRAGASTSALHRVLFLARPASTSSAASSATSSRTRWPASCSARCTASAPTSRTSSTGCR